MGVQATFEGEVRPRISDSTRLALGTAALGLVAGLSFAMPVAAASDGTTTVTADDVPPKKKGETTDKVTVYILDAKGSG